MKSNLSVFLLWIDLSQVSHSFLELDTEMNLASYFRFEFSLVVLSPRFWAPCMSDMESGPALAWLLLLSLLADCLKATQSRDFTVKDIIYLHPSSKTILFAAEMSLYFE